MVNNVRLLKVTDFIVDDALRPDDVTEVDILYKDTVSPNVYIVKTIKRSKNHEWHESGAGSFSGVLNITSEMIHRTLESSQILRAWDNVPRKALAQEVTGNRIVYGNYLQNYNVTQTFSVIPSSESILHPKVLTPYKSIKSLRRYKIGVVFGDKYGRETPVIEASTINSEVVDDVTEYNAMLEGLSVEKNLCDLANSIKVQQSWDNPLGNGDTVSYTHLRAKET